ncbi:MAG: hypothetical protein JW904_08025 [Spirochaetales bacterium]|nr:hypothetical protein [Spirochaetales bacterium]
MLKEFLAVRQVEGEGTRRWFFDEFFDLIVWYKNNKTISGFQLCYDKQHNERALTWYADSGYTHDRIDPGETPGEPKRTPILVQDGLFDNITIAGRFKQESAGIAPEISKFVYEKLLLSADAATIITQQ